MSAVIEVEGLQKRYGSTWAARDVSFEVNRGEIFGILGRNGAGKTTTVECLQGLRVPTGGRMMVLGHDPARRPAAVRSQVGSQLQDAALPDRMKVREAVRLFADDPAVDHVGLLEEWGLAGRARTAFADLSGGLQQRLFIALALINRPRVVFFDELTQGLDPSARREVWGAIEAVRDRGTTVVLVTHFMDEAEHLCDRVAVFDSGRVVAEGTPAQVIAAHADHATVSFTPVAAPAEAVAGVETCSGVTRVERVGEQIVAHGRPSMIPHVCAALVATGVPRDLRVEHASLEDAVVAIETAAA